VAAPYATFRAHVVVAGARAAPEQQAHDLAAGWMTEAGLKVSADAAGNLVGWARGSAPQLGEILAGSHLDTVPDGGRFRRNKRGAGPQRPRSSAAESRVAESSTTGRPAGLLFVRAGRAGVSHSPLEIVDAADITVAVEALARALTSLAGHG
jgi:acetylornithine deacetylase/succinyl-diaminopimelate desuccinylase-like protein